MRHITSLTPSRRDSSKLIIQVNGKSMATLSRRQIETIGLEIENEWTDAVAAKVADAVAFEGAFDQAMRMINRKRLSRAKVNEKLLERGHDELVVERVVAKLLAIGALNDETLATDLVDEIDRTRPAGPAMKRAKLAQRGVSEDVIDRIVGKTASPSSQLADARKLIASRSKALAKLDETTRKRRLWGLLARRGFDEETIDTVLGGAACDE